MFTGILQLTVRMYTVHELCLAIFLAGYQEYNTWTSSMELFWVCHLKNTLDNVWKKPITKTIPPYLIQCITPAWFFSVYHQDQYQLNWQISQLQSGRPSTSSTQFFSTFFHSFMYSCSLLSPKKTLILFSLFFFFFWWRSYISKNFSHYTYSTFSSLM